MSTFKKPWLTCKESHKLAVKALDVDLSLRERLGVKMHLLICHACQKFSRQMRFIDAAGKKLPFKLD